MRRPPLWVALVGTLAVTALALLLVVLLSGDSADRGKRAEQVERGLVRKYGYIPPPSKRFRARLKLVAASCQGAPNVPGDFWSCRLHFSNRLGERHNETATVCGADWAAAVEPECEFRLESAE